MKQRSILAFALACVLALGQVAYGEGLVLSEALTVIEEAAFAGDTSLSSVVLPEGILEIESRAFAESSVHEINIPSGIERIAADAFADVTYPLLIQTSPDSYGVSFALANELDFRADTVCRALVIAQSSYPDGYELKAPPKDAAEIENLLSGDYLVTQKENMTADQILSAIAQTFAEAKDTDISLLYYSGHGKGASDPEVNGSLVGIDFDSFVSPAQLRSALDGVKGRKIVLIDACYSGGFIGKGEETSGQMVIPSPAVSVVRAFQMGNAEKAALAAQQYFVFAASSGDELSWETKAGGVFTRAFVESRTSGDLNGDGVVTVQECYAYTSKRVQALVTPGNKIQTVQVYPEDCDWFCLFR